MAATGRTWSIEGRYVEYCSCDHGCPCETMAEPTYGDCTGAVLTCSDDACGSASLITPSVVAGTTYTIVVDGFSDGNVGPFTLSVEPAEP